MPCNPQVLGAGLIPGLGDGFIIDGAKPECDLDRVGETAAMTPAAEQGVENQIDLVLLRWMQGHQAAK